MRRIVVVSAHPDDETIGCGGTLLRHHKNGDDIYWIIVTSKTAIGGYPEYEIEERSKEIDLVKESLGIKEVIQFGYPTMSLSSAVSPDLIKRMSDYISKVQPQVIYTVNRSDAHSDHRIVYEAVMACTKSFRHPYLREVLMYECISETEFAPAISENAFIPNCFVDITDNLEKKIETLKFFKSEIESPPFPRSEENIRALARFRGSTAGVNFAEAFQLLKLLRIETI